MAGTITTGGGNTTLSFAYTTTTENMISIAEDAAHWLWDNGLGNHGTVDTPILFSSLTNQQKVDIIDSYFKKIIIDASNTYKSNAAAQAARDATIPYII
jgi:hypothetical protein